MGATGMNEDDTGTGRDHRVYSRNPGGMSYRRHMVELHEMSNEPDIHAKLAHMRREVAKLPKIDPNPRSSKARLASNVSGVAVFWGAMPKPPKDEA
jgi:hypothetical protein